MTTMLSPIDCCSGVVLHVFMSSPQDLPVGSHASVGPSGHGFNPRWVQVSSTDTLYCTVLYCTVVYCSVLYCTVLYCTVLYCTVLYCTVM